MSISEKTLLRISEDLCLPVEAATWVLSYLAKRGAGKTYNAAVQAEEMLKARIPIVVIDGMGIWWGLRVSADTKHPGLPVVVFGGDHPDLPLIPDKAADMAKAIVESNISCVLDLSGLSKRLSRRIVSDFLDELYKLNRVIRHVYIEEADLWAPQRTIGPEQDLCLSAVDNFVRRGGNHNLGVTLITQRSAVLNKDVLTQSDCLVILRTLAPQDKKAIRAWVEEQTDEDQEALKKWYDSLKSLKNGEAWVWHPEPPAVHERIMFRERETFHATREFLLTPEASKITLMSVDEFLECFTKVFKAGPSTAKMAPGTLDPGLMKELEEYRSGTKLAESVQKRLKFLGEQTSELTDKQGKAVELISELKEKLGALEYFEEALSGLLIPRLAELIKTHRELTTSTPGVNQTVGLQTVKTVVDVPVAEKRVSINTASMRGKILSVAKKGKLNSWQQLSVVVKAVEEERWSATPQEVNNALNDLEKDDLIAKKHTDRNYYCLAQGVVFADGVSS